MRKLLTLAVAVALAAPTASRAQLSVGARFGFAPSMGNAFKDSNTGTAVKLSDGVKSQVPIQIEAALRASKEIAVGAYFSYGIGQLGSAFKDECTVAGQSCSASDVRIGIQAFYSFTQVHPQLVPWAGVGFGYEWGTTHASGGGVPDESITFKGFELLNLQLGGDLLVSPQLSVGPYVMLSIAQFSTAEIESGGVRISGSIDKKAFHEWVGFGFRGKFDF